MTSGSWGGWTAPIATTMSTITIGPAGTARPGDYAGRKFDLALGEVHGLRLWRIDEYGRLRARNWQKAPPWRPGVNTARCLSESSLGGIQQVVDPSGKNRKAKNVFVEASHTVAPRYTVAWDDGSTEEYTDLSFSNRPNDLHPAPWEGCTCGFYAYTNPEESEVDEYRSHGEYVMGLIKGYGQTLIGSRGFRCEKAEIIALRDPTRGGRKTARWRQTQKDQLQRVYPGVLLIPSRSELLDFAELGPELPAPDTDEFWNLP